MLNHNDIKVFIYNFLFLILLLSSVFLRANVNKSKVLKQLAIWLLIIFIGTIIYNNRFLLKNFVPYIAESEENKLIINKSNDGHFYISVEINNKNIILLIDTGATITTISEKDAKKINIDIKKLIYNHPIYTANGTIYSAKTHINNLKINDFELNYLDIYINKNSDNSLLGMNFLNTLKGYNVREDRMILYY